MNVTKIYYEKETLIVLSLDTLSIMPVVCTQDTRIKNIVH